MRRKFKSNLIKSFNILQGGVCTRDNVSWFSGSLLTNIYYFSCVMELYVK